METVRLSHISPVSVYSYFLLSIANLARKTIQFRYMRRDKVNSHTPNTAQRTVSACAECIQIRMPRHKHTILFPLYLLSRQFLIILFLILVQLSFSSSFLAVVNGGGWGNVVAATAFGLRMVTRQRHITLYCYRIFSCAAQ